MKKILSIALIVALVATSAFAVSISGQADLGFKYDIDEKTFGFDNNGKMNKLEFKVAEEFFNESKEVKGEGSVYAGIKASLVIDWASKLVVNEISDDTAWNKQFNDGGYKAETTVGDVGFGGTWKVTAKIEEAYITNDVWKLNILGSKAASDYAKSAIDFGKKADDTVVYVSAVAPSTKVNPGFVFTMNGYLASLGLAGTATGTDVNAMAETKEYDFNGAKVQAALVAGNDAATKKVTFGASVKGLYATDAIAVNAAADFAVSKVADADAKFNMDAVAKFTGYGVTVDAYFALDATGVVAGEGAKAYPYTNKNLLSAKVAYDTTIEDVKVGIAFTGLDLVNTQDLAVSASATVGKISGTVYGGYIVKAESWKAGASATYTEDLYKVSGAIDAAKDTLTVEAKVSSDALVAGASLEAGYKSGNLLADPAKFGAISAKATIKF